MFMFPSILTATGKKDIVEEDIHIPNVGDALSGGVTVKGGILGTGGKIETLKMPYSQYQPTIVKHAPYEVFAPEVQFAPVTTYAYQGATTLISSPEAKVTKKQVQDIVSKPSQVGAWDIPMITSPTYDQPEIRSTGMNITHIAIIAVVGFIGYSIVKSKKK